MKTVNPSVGRSFLTWWEQRTRGVRFDSPRVQTLCEHWALMAWSAQQDYIDEHLTPAAARQAATTATLLGLLQRLREWDHLTRAADGPYWKSEIDTALAATQPQDTQP